MGISRPGGATYFWAGAAKSKQKRLFWCERGPVGPRAGITSPRPCIDVCCADAIPGFRSAVEPALRPPGMTGLREGGRGLN